MTSYDEIYTAFLSRCKVEDIDLPQTDAQIYDIIHNAISDFNNRLRDDLTYSDSTETVSRDLNNDHLLLLAHYIRLNFLKNQLLYFTNTWQPFAREISLKNFMTQLRTYKEIVKDQEKHIETLILNMSEDFL